MKELVLWTCFDCDRGFYLLQGETLKGCYFCQSKHIGPAQVTNKDPGFQHQYEKFWGDGNHGGTEGLSR